MSMMKEKFWLWGQNPGTHHWKDKGVDNPFNLPGINKMTPLEGLRYFNIPNLCRVVFQGVPPKPYDEEMKKFKDVQEMIWSIADYGNNGRIEDPDDDVREVIRQAKMYPNISGVIMDDFFTNKEHFIKYDVEQIKRYKQQLHDEVGRKMDLWVVIYTHDYSPEIVPFLEVCDVITMWTWKGEDFTRLEENLTELKHIAGKEKRYYAGCYMWDYGNAKALTNETMQFQLDTYLKWMRTKEIEGIVFCSNCVADLGIEAAKMAKKWIESYGNEIL